MDEIGSIKSRKSQAQDFLNTEPSHPIPPQLAISSSIKKNKTNLKILKAQALVAERQSA
jgi:hypothetical protein